jgi:tRNA (adenine22-N1)-methyltransferase
VRDGVGVADIGTDHGYIPVYLAQNGYSGKIIASDLRAGPIDSAKSSGREYGVYDKISFRLADGLNGVSPGEADTVIIAGMGGETIINILEAAAWTKSGVELILQPQSKVQELTDWLMSSGYAVGSSSLCRDDGRIYIILTAHGGNGEAPGLYCLDLLIKSNDPLWGEYLRSLILREENILRGLKMANGREDEKKRAEALINELRRIGEENGLWQL